MKLKEYASKRAFEKTPEPAPDIELRQGRLRFVVHKHAARRMHYDLRLELDGVLKSWAVPKGPSLDPTVKRLAVMVEDHPLEYTDFEGVIPEGNYGAGSVIVWDRGFYRHPSAQNIEASERLLMKGLEKGDLKFILEGEKLRGEFVLVRTGRDGKSWLLIKKKDKVLADDVLKENRSVVSQKTLEETIELGGSGEPRSFRQKKLSQIRLHEALETEDLADAPVVPMPKNVRPMLASVAEKPFDDPGWIFEVKWDGYRAIAEVREDNVSLYSRNGVSFTRKFSPIAGELRKFSRDVVLDGEIVVVDDEGRPDFQALQHYAESARGYLIYAVFDLLHFEGHDLTQLPLLRRKALLKEILPRSPRLRFSDHVEEDGVLFFNAAREKGLEGIVAKEGRSVYEPGRRTRQWLKVKARRTQDGVIAGFTEPGGARKHFGALVLGLFEGGEFRHIGQVGSGFSERDLRDIRKLLEPLVRPDRPFPLEPDTNSDITWVRPERVCEVEFAGWTEDAVMRQPVFIRLREDKTPREVLRE